MRNETLIEAFIDFQMPRLEGNSTLNRILVYIFTESKKPRARVRQVDLLKKFNLSKYKCAQILGTMDGAGLVETVEGIEYNYYVSSIGEKYLERYLQTKNGQEIIKELANERTV